MFKTMKNLTKAAVAVAVSPVDMVADVITLGGELSDRQRSYTADRFRQAGKALDAALEPEKERD